MAGEWIKVETALSDKPEVLYIAGIINQDADSVVGKLIRVWSWFDKHTVDGNALGVTFAFVDRLVGVTGFAEAMQFAGWLEQRDKVLSMPKFDNHNSESAKKRGLTAKRQSRFRNAGVTLETLPEKRRVEKILKPKNIAPAALVLPDWMPAEPWSDFVEMRKKIRAPLTDKAVKQAIATLAELKAQGHEPANVLNNSVLKSYRGLFAPPPDKPNGNNGSPQWWISDAGIQAKGAELGLSPRPGENWQQFKGRIQQTIGGSA